MTTGDGLQALLDRSWAAAGAAARGSWPEAQRMSAAEALAFLSGQRYCAIATVSPGGDPQLVPGSFVCAEDGTFWLPAVAGTARARSLRRHPRLALLVGQGVDAGHRLVLAQGAAEVVAPADLPARVAELARAKLGGLGWASQWLLMRPDRMLTYAGRPG